MACVGSEGNVEDTYRCWVLQGKSGWTLLNNFHMKGPLGVAYNYQSASLSILLIYSFLDFHFWLFIFCDAIAGARKGHYLLV